MRRSKAAILTSVVGCGLLAMLAFACAKLAGAAAPERKQGEVAFVPVESEETRVPEPFRLPPAKFSYVETPQLSSSEAIDFSLINFPSPVETPYAVNNTVHCEYYRPAKAGKYPACVVLHILGGDFPLSRTFATALAHRNVAALFLIMPYYGPRRPTDAKIRMVSTDPQQTVAGMTQAVKDIRYAAAFLAAREEVDPTRLGVFGISLGGITAALAGEAEPRFQKICPVLAGGGIQEILTHASDRDFRETEQRWLATGGTRDSLVALLRTVDPCTYGQCARGRQILMLNGSRDEIIPRVCTDALWDALGRPSIRWYQAGHFTAMFYMADAVDQITRFFSADQQ